jgi:hypothetical protein
MLRYFFNVYDDFEEDPDPDGRDLPMLHESLSEAVTGTRTLVISEVELIPAADRPFHETE